MKKDPIKSPILGFLETHYRSILADTSGSPADYIPELAIVNPDQFGIALTTVDGVTHSVGDCSVEFTIQSISKAFVYSLAVEKIGSDGVFKKIGVEPSGEAFNSIRLKEDNRPFNPMVNSGAISCTGLVCDCISEDTFPVILDFLSEFSGRKLTVNEDVYNSEKSTGDRNRAIAWLLKNNNQFESDVDKILDVYFKQCSILVSAKDLAVMAATLAKNGVNPITKKRIISTETAVKGLSIMVSAGMYDYSGEWTYRVGLPAKSGVGGGIVAVLPSEFGLGVFSPPLDELGNSVRGIKVCKELSLQFKLHLLQGEDTTENCVRNVYDLSQVRSLHTRNPIDSDTLDQFGRRCSVIELGGNITLTQSDSITRAITEIINQEFIIISLLKVNKISFGAIEILRAFLHEIEDSQEATIVFCGIQNDDINRAEIFANFQDFTVPKTLHYNNIDQAIEWVEDQLIAKHGKYEAVEKGLENISQQPILKNMTSSELDLMKQNIELLDFASGTEIISLGQETDGIFFLLTGKAEISLGNGEYLATVGAGTCFGELALISPHEERQANVIASANCRCAWLSADSLNRLFAQFSEMRSKMLLNLSSILVERLNKSNARVALNTAYHTRGLAP